MARQKKKEIAAGEFKSKCLEIMNEVQRFKHEVTITKRGIPVAKLVPVEDLNVALFGYLKDTVVVKGDLIAPIEESWESDG
jgi:prevent-host-death family protein